MESLILAEKSPYYKIKNISFETELGMNKVMVLQQLISVI